MKTTFKNFKLSATYLGNKLWHADNKGQNYNNHKITVVCDGLKTSFEFWQSIAKPKMESENDLLFAFYCFVSDSIAAKEDFKGFCAEFGYSEDKRAERIYKACQKSLAKLERIYSGDLYDLANELNELGL